MNIVLFEYRRGRSRSLDIPRSALAGVVLLVACGLAANAYFAWRYAVGDLLDTQVVDAWSDRLREQRNEVDELSAQARAEMLAVGRRLAGMEARLLRMEALGERVSEVANLTRGEFRFDMPAATGGPELPVDGVVTSDYLAKVDRLAADLRSRERELNVLESLLASRRFHADVAPSGRPVKWGWMSSPFGNRVDPISGQPAWHDGVDFAGKPGSDVVAVASGIVTFAAQRSGYGHMIEINHGGGFATRYGHHESVLVNVGDVVKKGQVVAKMGSTGRSTGPHVHFEVLKSGRHIDPARYIARRH